MRRVTLPPGPPVEEPFRILCVCTGNVYRSRIAEDELRRGIRDRLGSESDRFLVASAGTRATTGRALASSYARDLERLGIHVGDLAVTRRLEAADIRAADLVLGAERHHRTAVLELVPGALRRTFTLTEIARIGAEAAERAVVTEPASRTDVVVRARLVVAAASKHRGTVPPEGGDDIADPWDQPSAVLDLAARQVREAVATALGALVGDLNR